MHRVLYRGEAVLFQQRKIIVVRYAAVMFDLVISRYYDHMGNLLGSHGANIILQRALWAFVGPAWASIAQAWACAHTELTNSAIRVTRLDAVSEYEFRG